jgi:hypothetical protein
MISSLLAWQYTHEGVPSHYLFQRADLPELSNWWGVLVFTIIDLGASGQNEHQTVKCEQQSRKKKKRRWL